MSIDAYNEYLQQCRERGQKPLDLIEWLEWQEMAQAVEGVEAI